jgi:hypothetical protein
MDENKVIEVFDYYNNKNEHEKHLKGYMFDSLVYRYKQALTEAYLYKSWWERTEYNEKALNRDLMRFIQILNEAIGDHD